MRNWILILVSCLATVIGAQAAVTGTGEIVLQEARFHLGDAPAGWSEPGFDDSDWQTMAIPEKWHGEGMYAQYRIRFQVPKGFVKKAPYRKIAIFDLAFIDDCDETFLNGKPIGKSGRMPSDGGLAQSAWDKHRIYKVDSRLLKEGENLLTVMVWNRRTRGGVYGGPFVIRMAQLEDLVSLTCSDDGDASDCLITVSSDVRIRARVNVDGREKRVCLRPRKPFKREIAYDGSGPVQVAVSVCDKRTGQSIYKAFAPKYCLTPQAPQEPRYNSPAVLGVRPGSPVYFRLPFSGLRPMSFKVTGLPEGLTLDGDNGVVSGSVDKAGEYTIEFEASNEAGTAKGTLLLKVGDMIALTPPMGWNSWNCWGLDISEEKVFASARALIESGLADYGYSYVNIDDAWQGSSRSDDGSLQPNDNIPDIAALGDFLHQNGLRLGIYSSPGDLTCGGYLGSLGYEKKDADMWNSWGVDYLKYDLCGYRSILDTLPSVGKEEHMKPYLLMNGYLKSQPRDICYSLCQYGLQEVWTWGASAGANLWRTTGDITDTWDSVLRIGFTLQRELWPYAGPGHWNDPDMLVVGKVGWGEGLRDSRLTADEQYSHVSLWALLAAPLIIGGDLSAVDKFTLNLLCNNEIIAIDQDPMGSQARCLLEKDSVQVWGRSLSDGSSAAGIFNMGDETLTVNVKEILSESGYTETGALRDVWRQQDCPATVTIPSHGVLMVRF